MRARFVSSANPFVYVAVTPRVDLGAPENPTGATVKMAFVPDGSALGTAPSWTTAAWVSGTAHGRQQWYARCQVGDLDDGTYWPVVEYDDGTEVFADFAATPITVRSSS